MICIKIKRKFFNDQIKCFSIFKCSGMMAPEDTWSNSVFAPIHRLTTYAILCSTSLLGGGLHSQDRLGYAAVINILNLLPTPQGGFSLTFHVQCGREGLSSSLRPSWTTSTRPRPA